MKKVYIFIILFLNILFITKAGSSRSVYEYSHLNFSTYIYPFLERNKIIDDPRVKIFPNPTHENFKIEIELEKNSEVEIIIYNAIGKSIFASRESAQAGTYVKLIPFEDQPSGIYFVNIKSGDIKSVERIIKMK